ncbi:diguanylate cyclase domain-containing protein [Halomonadaceae bacterium KBTZ08]
MSDDADGQSLDSKLNKLRSAYRERLTQELGAIRAYAEPQEHDEDVARTVASLRHRLHKLAGSAGTFGFHQLGKSARTLEQNLQAALAQNADGQRRALEQARRQVAQLAESLNADENLTANVGVEAAGARSGPDVPYIGLIERDQILADYIAHQLESFGYRIQHYRDPQAFLAGDEPAPDLLLVDHRAGVAEHHPTPTDYWQSLLADIECPVIFMGGHEDFWARLEAVRAGADSYFVKPLDIPKIAARISRTIQDRRQGEERVLIVDDDEALLEHLATVLTHAGMVVETLCHSEALLDRTSDFRPELVLMDLHMPEVSGDELAAMLRQFDQWSNLPILYLSQEQEQQQRIDALIRGGDDFINKPVSDEYLIKTCRSRVRRLRTVEQAIALDGLTGLLRHANIKEALETELQGARRSGNPLSVVMLDIDHFKQVNDSYGHALGDMVISTVGTLMAQHFRRSDRLGRYGGEEFVAVLPNCDVAEAERLINTLRGAFSEISFFDDTTRFSCTLSAGIADTETSSGRDGEQLLKQADIALYRSKQAGRNCVSRAFSQAEPP